MTGPLRPVGSLTGRARGRPGWFGRLVLQVEVRTDWMTMAWPRPDGTPGASEVARTDTAWRDATWEDVQAGQLALRNWGHEPPRPMPGSTPPDAVR